MSEKVTFQELVDSIADQTDNTKQLTHDFLKDFVSVINEGLDSDGKVNIAGLGKFKLRTMDEREGVNPQTGEKITIPTHNKVIFKPYKDLRELVNAPYEHLEPELLEEKPEDTSEVENPSEEKSSHVPDDKLDVTLQEKEQAHNEKEVAEPAVQGSGDEEDPFGFNESDSKDEPISNTEISQKDNVEHDIVEYSPHLQEATKDPSSDDMLLNLPTMQRSKIREPENPEGVPEKAVSAEPETENIESIEEEEDHIVEDPFEDEFAPVEKGATDDQADMSEGQDPQVDSSKVPDEPEETDDTLPDPYKSQTDEPSNKSTVKSRFRIVAAAAVLFIIGVGIWYLFASRTVDLENMSGMITQIADRHWNQSSISDQPEESLQQQSKQTRSVDHYNPNRETQASSTQVTIPEGQTLWSLANQEYDDPYLWPWIYDKNKTSINSPDKVLAGQSLSVPVPSGQQGLLAGEDSLGVALGYVETYRWYKANNYNKAKYYLYAAKTYRGNVFDHTNVEIDKADLVFANRIR